MADPNNDKTGEILLDPEQTRLALEQSIERVNSFIATLEEAQRTREEIFDLVVSV